MTEQYYLSFDAGTQSVKVAVYNGNMECITKVSNQTTLNYPHSGWVEMDADEYLALTKLGMKQCIVQLNNYIFWSGCQGFILAKNIILW